MAELDFEQFLKSNADEKLDFEQFLYDENNPKPGFVGQALKAGEQYLRDISSTEPEKETAPGRVEPPLMGTDPMGDSAGLAIMRDAPMPAAEPERVRDSSVFQEQPRDQGLGNEGDQFRDVGLGVSNAMGDFYDPAGGNVVAGQLASKLVAPFTMSAAKGMAGSIGEAARGLNVMSELLTNEEIKLDWAKDLADWSEGQAKLVRGEINSLSEVRGVGDFGTYLMERFGEGFGGFAPFMLGGVATGVGIGAVQGIGATYNALLEDKGIQDKLKSGELTQQDIRRISLIGGAVNGLATGLMVKYIGDPGKFTQNFTRDLARLAVADPAMFAVGGFASAATTELLAGYFGGNEDFVQRAAKVADATVNAFFSGVPFGGVKVAGRIERRAEERAARPPAGVDPAVAEAVKPDAGTATTTDIDPTVEAAAKNDLNERAKELVRRVREQRAAEEAAAKTTEEAKPAPADVSFSDVVEAQGTKAYPRAAYETLQKLPEGTKLYTSDGVLTFTVEHKEPVTGIGAFLSGRRRFPRTVVRSVFSDGTTGPSFGFYTSKNGKSHWTTGRLDFSELSLTPPEGKTKRQIEDENIKAGIEATQPEPTIEQRTQGEPTVAEKPEQFEAQVNDMVSPEAGRSTVLFPEGVTFEDRQLVQNGIPPLPEGMKSIKLPSGTRAYYNPKKITAKALRDLDKKGRLNEALGMGETSKTEAVRAVEERGAEPAAITVRDEAGTPKTDALTSSETVNADIAKVAEQAAPTDTVEVRTPQEVIAERVETPPAGAGPKTGPIVERVRRRVKAPEKPKAEAPEAPVTTEVTPPKAEQPPRRILRSAEQEAELAREAAAAQRGYRLTTEGDNRDFGVVPDTTNPKARDRFVRRALASVKAAGDAAPQYYKDAAEAKSGQTRGRSAANTERTKKIDAAWQQEHEANLETIERRRVAEEEAAAKAELPEPETPPEVEKRDYTDAQVKAAIDDIVETQLKRQKDKDAFLALPKEQLEEIARLHLDSRKSDKSGGQADVNDQQNYISLDENRAKAAEDAADNYAKLTGREVSIYDLLKAEYSSRGSEKARLAERLNNMTDSQFKNWIVRSDKGEFLAAVRANAEFPISRLQTSEFRRLINEISDEPIYASRETTVREMFAENVLTGDKKKVRNALSDFIESRIMRLIGDMKVMVVDNDTMRRANILTGRSDRIAGAYDPIKNHILIHEDYYVPGTREGRNLIIHEALHGVLANAIRRNKALAKQIESLRDFVKSELENNPELKAAYEALDVRYGLKNADEFISETWSNPDFQDLLTEIKISDAQLRAMNINPAGGWVRDTFKAMVDLVRQTLGTTPNTRSALEEAIRYTDRAFEEREALPRGAKYSALKPEEMARAMAAREVRDVNVPDYAARRGIDASIRRELESRGVDRETATELVNVLKEELGADFNFKNAKPFIDELASNFGSNEQPKPKAETEIKKEATTVAEAMFVPTASYRTPTKATIALSRLNEIAQMGDRIFGKDTNPLRTISDLVQMQGREKAKILTDFEADLIELAAASNKFKGNGFEEMVAIALDASRAQVHPDVPLADPKNKHLGKDKMSGVWGKSQHPQLAERFKALADKTPELAQIYTKIRDMLPKMLDARLRTVVDAVLRGADIDDPAVAQRFMDGKTTAADVDAVGPILAKHIANVVDAARLDGPYFNFARRGDFVVHGRYKIEAPANATKVRDNTFDFKNRKDAEEWVRKQSLPTSFESVYIDPKTGKDFFTDDKGEQIKVTKQDVDGEQRFRVTVQDRYTEFVESLSEAKSRTKELRDEGLAMSDPEDRKNLTTGQWRDLLPNQIRSLMETAEQRLGTSKLTPTQRNEITGILNEFSITMMGPNRIQSTQMPRRNVAGMSTDFVRNTIEYMERSAGYMARTRFQEAMTKALKDLNDRTEKLSALGTGNGTMARRLANEVENRVIGSNAIEEASSFGRNVDRVNALSYADKLLSLGYSMTNLTQITYTFAELGGDHGAARSAYHIVKAYNDVSAGRLLGRGAAETVKAVIGKDGNAPYIEQVKARLSPKEQELLDFLVDRGVVDPDAGFDMTAIKRQRGGKTIGDKVVAGADKGIDYLSNVARALPRAVEAVNRTVTALAAYRLEMKRNGGDHEKAMRYAQDVVSNSQFNSSPTNVPPTFRNKYLRLPLQFKLFLQGSIHAVGRQVGRAIRNESPGDRVKAVRALAIYTASYAAMAGVLGLPGMELAKIALLLANALNISDFKPSDFERMVRRYMAGMLGNEGGEIASRGLTRMIGVDTSNRLGFPTILFGEPRGDTEDAAWAYVAKLVGGAPTAYVVDAVKGFRAAMSGDWQKAAELTIPIKALSDYLKADRVSKEGLKNEAGRQTFTPYTTQEKVTRAIGFTPAREAERFEERSAIQGDLARYNKERQKLMNDWVSNPNNRAKAMIAIEKFNRGKPKDAQIDMKDLRASEKRRQTEEKKGTVVQGIRTNKRNQYILEDIDYYNTGK